MSEISLKIGKDDDDGDKKGFLHKCLNVVVWLFFLSFAVPVVALMWDTVTGNEEDGLFVLIDTNLNDVRDAAVDWRLRAKHDRERAERSSQHVVPQDAAEVETDEKGRLLVKEAYTADDLEAHRILRDEILRNPEYGETEQEAYDRLLKEGIATKEELDWLRSVNGGKLREFKGPPEHPRTRSEIEGILRGDLPKDYKMPGSDTDPSANDQSSKNSIWSWRPWNRSSSSEPTLKASQIPAGGYSDLATVGREEVTRERVRELFKDHTATDQPNLDDGDGVYRGPHYRADDPDCVVDPNSYGLPDCLGFD